MFVCPRCAREFEKPRAFGIHVVRAHPDEQVALRIEVYTDRRGPNECWPWRSHHSAKGYATVEHQKYSYRVSRLLLGLKPRDGVIARHTCDNPGCVNPAHLMRGTQADNMQDAVDRGRTAKGEDNGGGKKLTDSDVREIKKALRRRASQASLARMYGVSAQTIYLIKTERRWTHIKED